MKYFLLIAACYLLFAVSPVSAVTDPLSVPNNRYGVHILEPGELMSAAKLINSNGGKWGYVTVPIRSDDRDREKWTRFFIQCRNNYVIPIIRLATYINGDKWVTPSNFDLVDFANFLNDMPWPVKNRYITIFNEPNHSNEWGGMLAPTDYASLLIEARDIFKTRSDDFYILNAGLDMSAPNSATSMDALLYYRKMTRALPGWYQAIDGFAVHAYPNPGFKASPLSTSRYGITSYRYETNLLKSLGLRPDKPVFITETGYTGNNEFYKTAFTSVWRENNIVAVTPFVLFAGAGNFVPFSLTDSAHNPRGYYNDIYNLPKISGSPLLNPPVADLKSNYSFPSKDSTVAQKRDFIQDIKNLFSRPSPRLVIGDTDIVVEVADNSGSRERGLSNRKNLAANSGMLFIFPQSQMEIFWMKDMNFPLDFIWINKNQVVNLTENVPPPSQNNGNPMIISSTVPVDKVLEVNAGFIKNHQIKNGDIVVLNSPE